jgi:hypothetical protein
LHLPAPPRRRLASVLSMLLLCCGLGLASGAATVSARPAGEAGAAREQRQAERQARRALRQQEREARRASRRQRHGEPSASPQQATEGSTPPAEAGSDLSGRSARGCRLELQSSAATVAAGETVTLKGVLQCPTEAAAENRRVEVGTRGSATSGASTLVAHTTSTADGSFQLETSPLEANTVFVARAGKRRAHVAVRVTTRVTLAAGAAVPAGSAGASSASRSARRAAFTGTIAPAREGALVALQAQGAGGAWHSVAWAHTVAGGGYTVEHSFHVPGPVLLRALVHYHGKAPGLSETVEYEAAQPQNPNLTVTSSRDPLQYGQTATIAGVAAAGTGQAVTLLARTDGAYAPVATGVTGAEGSYSFEVAPQRSTLYRVVLAAERSTVLHEAVDFALSPDPVSAVEAAGHSTSFSGTVAPGTAGQRVLLESRYKNGVAFHQIAEGILDAAGRYSIAYSFPRAGTYLLRLRVPAAGGLQTTFGPSFEALVGG